MLTTDNRMLPSSVNLDLFPILGLNVAHRQQDASLQLIYICFLFQGLMLTTDDRLLLSSVNIDLIPISELNVDHRQQATIVFS
jgi:hypothetical protein